MIYLKKGTTYTCLLAKSWDLWIMYLYKLPKNKMKYEFTQVFHYDDKVPPWIVLRQITRIAHDSLSVCTKSESFHTKYKIILSWPNIFFFDLFNTKVCDMPLNYYCHALYVSPHHINGGLSDNACLSVPLSSALLPPWYLDDQTVIFKSR